MIELNVQFETTQDMEVQFSEDLFSCEFEGVRTGDYSGAYTVTPSDIAQVLPTAGKTLEQNIVIEPIPQNYGKIEWDGSTIFIS